MTDPNEPTEAEVEAVIEEFGGDLRATIRALLHDIAVLASDFAATVSRGYVRGRASPGCRRTQCDKESSR
jgi:hypothetical protein